MKHMPVRLRDSKGHCFRCEVWYGESYSFGEIATPAGMCQVCGPCFSELWKENHKVRLLSDTPELDAFMSKVSRYMIEGRNIMVQQGLSGRLES